MSAEGGSTCRGPAAGDAANMRPEGDTAPSRERLKRRGRTGPGLARPEAVVAVAAVSAPCCASVLKSESVEVREKGAGAAAAVAELPKAWGAPGCGTLP